MKLVIVYQLVRWMRFCQTGGKWLIYAQCGCNGGRYALDDTIMYKEVTKYRDISFMSVQSFP